MRIRVVERHFGHERAALAQQRDDLRVRLPDGLAGEVLDVRHEAAVVVDRVVDLEPVLAPELVVLFAVTGRHVHEAGAGVHRHEIADPDLPGAVDPRMAVLETRERAPRDAGALADGAELRDPRERLGELRGDDERLAPRLQRDVVLVGMHGDAEVRGKRPRRGRPDDERRARRVGHGRQRAEQRELHVDGRRALILVLHLGLRERRLAVHAPVDRLEALVDEAAGHEPSELARDHALVRGRHRRVRVVPVAEDAEPLELLALDVDELLRVRAAAPDLLHGIHRAAHVDPGLVEPELHVDLVLDGQTVAVEAGHVHGVEAEHRARLHHDVLQHLVEDVPHVDVAVRIGRPVVEDPRRTVSGRFAQPLVDPDLLPPREHLRLGLRQVRLHREGRFRQIQRGFVIHDAEASSYHEGVGGPESWGPHVQDGGRLLLDELHDPFVRVDRHVEVAEEVLAEQAFDVPHVHLVRGHDHAAHARGADLERVDGDLRELDLRVLRDAARLADHACPA